MKEVTKRRPHLMNNKLLPYFFVAALCLAPAVAQEEAKPLSQDDLLKTIDALGEGDPLGKSPLGTGAAVGDLKIGNTKSQERVTAKDKGPTVITALELSLDSKAHQAIFTGSVVVKDPEFNVTCDKLTAILKSQDKAAPGGGKSPQRTGPASDAAPVSKKPAEQKGGGLERAIAVADSGKKVVIMQEKTEADGSVTQSIGRGEKADYSATSGEIVLTGWPEVQQGFNTIIATERSTVITLNRAGRMNVAGPYKMEIKSKGPDLSSRR
jgi:lipopolysaccharide export system protein LptA